MVTGMVDELAVREFARTPAAECFDRFSAPWDGYDIPGFVHLEITYCEVEEEEEDL
jgi:hypothetical protein